MTGRWVVKTRTAADRFRRTLKRISQWCKVSRHAPLEVQQRVLNQKLRGHYGYYWSQGQPGAGSRTPRVANACLEEPDAGNLHVRIRGGPGKATTRGYPTSRVATTAGESPTVLIPQGTGLPRRSRAHA
jgi:hypothetical protein